MPQVPTYDQSQVQPQALPSARQQSVASPSLFGERSAQITQLGTALTQAGADFLSLETAAQERDNLEKTQAAEAEYKRRMLDYQVQAQQNEIGAAAEGATKRFGEWHDKQIEEISRGLGNDAQRKVFSRIATTTGLAGRHEIATFEVSEKSKAGVAAYEASVANNINLGAIALTPESREYYRTRVENDTRAFAATRKMGEDVSQRLLDMKLAEYHAHVIQNIVNKGDPLGAEAYFTANKGEILDVKLRESVEAVLKAGTVKEVAQRTATKLIADGVDEKAGLAKIRGTLHGDEQEAAVIEWQGRWARDAAARERDQSTAADDAYGIYAKTGRMSAIPAGVIARLDGKVFLALKRDAQGLHTETDWDKWYALRQQAYADPEGFSKRDLRKDFYYLGVAERKEIVAMQKAGLSEIKDSATLDTQLSSMHNELGWGTGDMEKKGAFDRKTREAVRLRETQAGRKLDETERQKIIDRMVLEERRWFGANKRYYEVAGTTKEATFTPIVPADERLKITDALRRKGQAVTDENILRFYKIKYGIQ